MHAHTLQKCTTGHISVKQPFYANSSTGIRPDLLQVDSIWNNANTIDFLTDDSQSTDALIGVQQYFGSGVSNYTNPYKSSTFEKYIGVEAATTQQQTYTSKDSKVSKPLHVYKVDAGYLTITVTGTLEVTAGSFPKAMLCELLNLGSWDIKFTGVPTADSYISQAGRRFMEVTNTYVLHCPTSSNIDFDISININWLEDIFAKGYVFVVGYALSFVSHPWLDLTIQPLISEVEPEPIVDLCRYYPNPQDPETPEVCTSSLYPKLDPLPTAPVEEKPSFSLMKAVRRSFKFGRKKKSNSLT